MIYGSVCSGIEAASAAFEPLGWKAAFFSEIEPFPSAVLKHHYPETPNLGDMTRFKEWNDYAIELLVGGTPCQSFSVAGLRKGLSDPRGNLMLTFIAIAARYRPQWLVWENVCGVFSSNDGRDFATLLEGLTGRKIEVPEDGWRAAGAIEGIPEAYGIAWRTLDAQFVRVESHPRAVPQRRRRVFVAGYLGDWRRAAAVLFERASMQGNPPPSRKAGKRTAGTISARTKGGGGLGTDFELDGGLTATHAALSGLAEYNQDKPTRRAAGGDCGGGSECLIVREVAHAVVCHQAKGGDPTTDNYVAHTLKAEGFDASEDGSGRATPIICVHGTQASNSSGRNAPNVATPMAVRRLTPRECERLQGFSDDYTLIPIKKRASEMVNYSKDGPRYKALGNSMAINCMSWIGQRIQSVENIK